MFAIFEQGGKQYKVTQGDIIRLEKFDAKEGEKVNFKQVLLVSDGAKDIQIGQPFVTISVEAKVIAHGRGEKIRVVRYKSKKRYHKVQGHRQCFTEVEILSIGAAKAVKKAEVKTETTEETTEKKAPVKKTMKKTEA